MVCCGRRHTLPDGTGGGAVSNMAFALFLASWLLPLVYAVVASAYAVDSISKLERRVDELENRNAE